MPTVYLVFFVFVGSHVVYCLTYLIRSRFYAKRENGKHLVRVPEDTGYREKVLGPAGVIFKCNDDRHYSKTASGESLQVLFDGIFARLIVGDNANTTTPEDEIIRISTNIDDWCTHAKVSPSQGREIELVKRFVNEARIFDRLEDTNSAYETEGLREYCMAPTCGPKPVIANISRHIRPDYVYGYTNLDLTTSDQAHVPQQLIESAKSGSKSERPNLLLPYFTCEFKVSDGCKNARIVENQLARDLSITADREWELERRSGKESGSNQFPVIGLSTLGESFSVWAMWRFVTEAGMINYEMRKLATYQLNQYAGLENFLRVVANIGSWASIDRTPYLRGCIRGALSPETLHLLELWRNQIKPIVWCVYSTFGLFRNYIPLVVSFIYGIWTNFAKDLQTIKRLEFMKTEAIMYEN